MPMSPWITRKLRSSLVSVLTVLALLFGVGAITLETAPQAHADDGGYPYANMACVWAPYATSGTASTNWCKKVNSSGTIVSDYDWGTIQDNTSNSSELSPYGYDYRNCTDYVAWKLSSLGVPASIYKGLSNAKDWGTNAASHGITVNATPAVGSAAIKTTGTYGHVAFVTAVNSDGTIAVSEYNEHEDGNYGTRTGTPSALGFGQFAHFEAKEASSGGPSGGGGGGGGTVGVGSSLCKCGSILVINEALYQGQYIESPDGQYAMLQQTDGNLVTYGPQWNSQNQFSDQKAGQNIGYVVLQPDGNFVAYTPDGRTALWSNGKSGSGGTMIVLQNDGNVVEYTANGTPVWASNTGVNNSPPAYRGGDELQINEGLYQNQYIESENGRCFAMLQTDGTFVLYTAGDHTFYGMGSGSGAGYFVLQLDGNFVGYMPNGQTATWSNNKSGSGGSYLVLQDDCNLVEYQANGTTAVWASNTAGLT